MNFKYSMKLFSYGVFFLMSFMFMSAGLTYSCGAMNEASDVSVLFGALGLFASLFGGVSLTAFCGFRIARVVREIHESFREEMKDEDV